MEPGWTVDVQRCIGCGACAILAPAVFAVVKRVRITRPPETAAERAAVAAAALVCPTRAIGSRVDDRG